MMRSATLHPHPTRAQLLKATALAMVVAGVVLVTAVLPAEYGIDPTGIGKRLGLLGMSADVGTPVEAPPLTVGTPEPVPPIPSGAGGVVRNQYVAQSAIPFRTSAMSVTLAPGKGAEIKARMLAGEQFTFDWRTDAGTVEFDMHGEKVNAAKDEFTSYWLARAANAAGSFVAPFDGVHGWYWHNDGTTPITVTVTVSGFYSELFRP